MTQIYADKTIRMQSRVASAWRLGRRSISLLSKKCLVFNLRKSASSASSADEFFYPQMTQIYADKDIPTTHGLRSKKPCAALQSLDGVYPACVLRLAHGLHSQRILHK
jgi:hypothetical protein